jgi:transaldolase
MPAATLAAVADHAEIPTGSIAGCYDDAERVLDELATLGIDYHDVVQDLEDQGVAKFDAAWDELGGKLVAALGGHPGRA